MFLALVINLKSIMCCIFSKHHERDGILGGCKFRDHNIGTTQDPFMAWERYGARWLGLQPSTFLLLVNVVTFVVGKKVWQKWHWMQFRFFFLIHPRPFLTLFGMKMHRYVPNQVFFYSGKLSALIISVNHVHLGLICDEKMLLLVLHWEGRFHLSASKSPVK